MLFAFLLLIPLSFRKNRVYLLTESRTMCEKEIMSRTRFEILNFFSSTVSVFLIKELELLFTDL